MGKRFRELAVKRTQRRERRQVWLAENTPPGMTLRDEKMFFWTGMVCAIAGSLLLYAVSYWDAYWNLYGYDTGLQTYVLLSDAVMIDFIDVLGGWGNFIGFFVLMVAMTAFVGYHYLYFLRGSRSIYLMKRLPNRWERHRRCWALPLCYLFLCIAVMMLLLVLYFGFYWLVTPKKTLSGGQLGKLLRALF